MVTTTHVGYLKPALQVQGNVRCFRSLHVALARALTACKVSCLKENMYIKNIVYKIDIVL
jgi:hypothetical protein